jgi:hypothetical protein
MPALLLVDEKQCFLVEEAVLQKMRPSHSFPDRLYPSSQSSPKIVIQDVGLFLGKRIALFDFGLLITEAR